MNRITARRYSRQVLTIVAVAPGVNIRCRASCDTNHNTARGGTAAARMGQNSRCGRDIKPCRRLADHYRQILRTRVGINHMNRINPNFHTRYNITGHCWSIRPCRYTIRITRCPACCYYYRTACRGTFAQNVGLARKN